MPKTNTASSPNPSKFTKVVLQKELKRRGVKFDLSALKPELVSLYRSEILGKLSGFSSDEDSPSVRITRTRSMESRANRLSVSLSRIDTTETDKVSDLTDKQLSAELKKIGVNTGPIGPTTRRIYERKLKNLRDIEGKKETAVPDQEYSSEESDEEAVEVVTTPKLVTRSQKRQASARSESLKAVESKHVIIPNLKLSRSDSTPDTSPGWDVISSTNMACDQVSPDSLFSRSSWVERADQKSSTRPSVTMPHPGISPIPSKGASADSPGLNVGFVGNSPEGIALTDSFSKDTQSSAKKKIVGFDDTPGVVSTSNLSEKADHSPCFTPKTSTISSAGHTPFHNTGPKVHPSRGPPVSTLVHGIFSPNLPVSEYSKRIKTIWYALSTDCESATKRRPLHSRTKKEEIIVKQQPDASVPSAQSSEQESKSKMSPWILVTTFVAIAAFLYFVYITMEENPPRLPFLNRKA